jgi:spore germination cell wall hydrolase CwlJ-like protein
VTSTAPSSPRWLHLALWIGGAIAVLSGLYTFTVPEARPIDSEPAVAASLAPPPTPVPEAEPLEIKAIARETAVEINAAVPFTKGPHPAARPFQLAGSPNDYARAVDCLASAIYYEAGNETLDGQRAVAQVVLNRVRHPAFPKTVCGVVYQGQERTTGCQFSFTCDGSMARIPSDESWKRVQQVARNALGGYVYKPVGLATHYHTDWVVPVWSASLDKLRAEGTHLFFRWAGWWGTPPAFRGSYAGNEDSIAKLARISLVHSDTDGVIDGLVIDSETGLPIEGAQFAGQMPQQPLRPGVPSTAIPRFVNAAGDFKIFLVDRKMDHGKLFDLAQSACTGKQYCKVLVWVEGAWVPSALPITEPQLNHLAFSYLRNVGSGYDKALWNCAVFSGANPDNCMVPRKMDRQPLERNAKALPAKPKATPPAATASDAPADSASASTS